MPSASRALGIHWKTVGDGRPAVILHGLTIDHRYVEFALEPVFATHPGWKRIYVDLPGHGESRDFPIVRTNDQMVDVIAKFIEDTLPEQRFILVGQSYAGYIARGVAARLRDRLDGLMLWVSAVYPRESRHLPPRSVLKTDAEVMAEASTDDERQNAGFLVVQSREGMRAVKELVRPGNDLFNPTPIEGVLNSSFSVEPDSLPFGKPTLIISGRQDWMVGYRDQWELVERYPRATFATIDYSGHFLGVAEGVVPFRALVADWLDRVEAESPTR